MATGESGALGSLVLPIVAESGIFILPSSECGYRLGQSLSSQHLLEVDAVVHFAYDKAADKSSMHGPNKNIAGTRLLAEQVLNDKKRFIFISSDSADFNTTYGRNKSCIEDFLVDFPNAASLRVGLVDSPDPVGAFGTILKFSDLLRLRIHFPSKVSFSLTNADEIAQAIIALLRMEDIAGIWSAAKFRSELSITQAVDLVRPDLKNSITIPLPAVGQNLFRLSRKLPLFTSQLESISVLYGEQKVPTVRIYPEVGFDSHKVQMHG